MKQSELTRPDVQLREHLTRSAIGVIRFYRAIEKRATLYDCAMKEPFGSRHRHQRAHFTATARFPKNRDISRVATKRGNVVPHPLQHGYNVKHSDVAGFRI